MITADEQTCQTAAEPAPTPAAPAATRNPRKRARQESVALVSPCKKQAPSPARSEVSNNFINNQMTISKSRSWIKVYDPSTQRLLTKVPDSTQLDVVSAIEAASGALPSWSNTSILQRRQKLMLLHGVMQRRASEFKHAIAVEAGKTLPDAEAEVERAFDAVESACAAINEIYGNHWHNQGTDVYTVHEPVGVCLSITPFNFPLLMPLWSVPLALATGNTVILKPSEKTPTASMLLAECVLEAKLPPGVFNIVHGGYGAVEKLLSQPAIRAVSFIGSEVAGERVYEHAKATRKRVRAECSGKNHGVVLEDAKKPQSLYAIAGSAFGYSGQRCMALSVAVFVGETKDWIPELAEISKSLKVGCSLEEGVEVGPIISVAAKERVLEAIANAEIEGARIALDGRNVSVSGYPNGNFVGPTILANVKPHMQCYQEEIFGPVLCCLEVDSLEEAVELVNENRFGNGCAIFTTDPVQARTFQREVNVGQIGINVPVLAASGPVPRTSNKDSFLGDLHVHDRSNWQFFTMTKTVTSLWR